MNTDKDIISSAMEEFGLTMDDVIVLMKGYEKFTEYKPIDIPVRVESV